MAQAAAKHCLAAGRCFKIPREWLKPISKINCKCFDKRAWGGGGVSEVGRWVVPGWVVGLFALMGRRRKEFFRNV